MTRRKNKTRQSLIVKNAISSAAKTETKIDVTDKKVSPIPSASTPLTVTKTSQPEKKVETKVETKTNTYTAPKNNYSYSKTLPELPKVDYEDNIDYELYFTLLGYRSHSRGQVQEELLNYLENFATNLGATTYRDTYGNLYVIKGEADLYPCAISHTDINQAVVENVRIYKNAKWIFGFNMDEGKQCGLGADDKNGIYFCLAMLRKFDVFKCVFFKDEEVG